jgi:hypothetical protein
MSMSVDGEVKGFNLPDDDLTTIDVEALCFLVLMEAARSSQEDLKSIMDGVKAINKEKEGWRSVENVVNNLAADIASKIALRPRAILAAPAYSLNAAHELCRWIEFIKSRSG